MELYCSLILKIGNACTGEVGASETGPSGSAEATLEYHPCIAGFLTCGRESGRGTLLGGQFDWGGRLQKSNGGAQRLAQHGRKSCTECKRISQLDCETDGSSRYESRS